MGAARALSGTVSPALRLTGATTEAPWLPRWGRHRVQAVAHTCGSPESGWRRRRRLFNAWRDTPSRPAATP